MATRRPRGRPPLTEAERRFLEDVGTPEEQREAEAIREAFRKSGGQAAEVARKEKNLKAKIRRLQKKQAEKAAKVKAAEDNIARLERALERAKAKAARLKSQRE